MLQGGCHHATYDELDEHLHRVSARDEGAAAGPRPGEEGSPGTETWRVLYPRR
jgi:hypothetical protein